MVLVSTLPFVPRQGQGRKAFRPSSVATWPALALAAVP